jgi:biopolymer transport protein ExbD
MAHPRSAGRPADGIYEPNMTPLIDVSLVLVVILMVATPLAFQSGIGVHAAAASGKAAVSDRDARVEIVVAADGTVSVNRMRVPRAELASRLRPLLTASSGRTVVVRCEDNVPHGEFVAVLDEARSLGATRLAVVGE